MLNRFRRILSKGKYIPEIDGIRFWAIASVVLGHISGFYSVRKGVADNIFSHLAKNGLQGVQLFFILSGYVLSKPFCTAYLNNSAPPTLKSYYIRRVTRLEPPYVAAVILWFISLVYVQHKFAATELLPALGSALTYTTEIFHKRSQLNGVYWSLQVEVQFYMSAPFFCWIIFKKITNASIRLITLIAAMIIFSRVPYLVETPFRTLFDYFHLFLAGILLSNISIYNIKLNKLTSNLVAIVLIIVISSFHYGDNINYSMLMPFLAVVLFYLIIFKKALSCIFSNPVICVIGGACYSIYLIHYPLISIIGNKIIDKTNYTVFILIECIFVLIASSIFYLLIERPCMDKNWPKKVAALARSIRAPHLVRAQTDKKM